ncbi:hypothetical protein BC628DRAFT_634079 [Trametes gibbosa]|nr:hypothetical protein BC628DRAFT_634079 [Trametes gibbosa]
MKVVHSERMDIFLNRAMHAMKRPLTPTEKRRPIGGLRTHVTQKRPTPPPTPTFDARGAWRPPDTSVSTTLFGREIPSCYGHEGTNKLRPTESVAHFHGPVLSTALRHDTGAFRADIAVVATVLLRPTSLTAPHTTGLSKSETSSFTLHPHFGLVNHLGEEPH